METKDTKQENPIPSQYKQVDVVSQNIAVIF